MGFNVVGDGVSFCDGDGDGDERAVCSHNGIKTDLFGFGLLAFGCF